MVRDPAGLDWPAVKTTLEDAGLEVPQVVTGEFFGADGLCLVTADLSHIEYGFFNVKEEVVAPEEIEKYDGVITFGPRFTTSSFSGDDRLTIIARRAVGYEGLGHLAIGSGDRNSCPDSALLG